MGILYIYIYIYIFVYIYRIYIHVSIYLSIYPSIYLYISISISRNIQTKQIRKATDLHRDPSKAQLSAMAQPEVIGWGYHQQFRYSMV